MSNEENFYKEDGCIILTEKFLAYKGQCCSNGCRHCPFEPRHIIKGNDKLNEDVRKRLDKQ